MKYFQWGKIFLNKIFNFLQENPTGKNPSRWKIFVPLENFNRKNFTSSHGRNIILWEQSHPAHHICENSFKLFLNIQFKIKMESGFDFSGFVESYMVDFISEYSAKSGHIYRVFYVQAHMNNGDILSNIEVYTKTQDHWIPITGTFLHKQDNVSWSDNYQTILSYVMDKVDDIISENRNEKSLFISREYWNNNLYHETL